MVEQQQQMSEEQVKALQEKIKNMSPEELKEFQKKQCIFCQIISGKVPSKKIYEDAEVVAILDINPATPGHVLVMPKEHYSIMPQIPDDVLAHLFVVVKTLSNAALRSLEVQGSNIIVANGVAAGQKAQHFMAHLIPRKEGDAVSFEIPQKEHSETELEKLKKDLIVGLGSTVSAATKGVVEADFTEHEQTDHEDAHVEESTTEVGTPAAASSDVDLEDALSGLSGESAEDSEEEPEEEDSDETEDGEEQEDEPEEDEYDDSEDSDEHVEEGVHEEIDEHEEDDDSHEDVETEEEFDSEEEVNDEADDEEYVEEGVHEEIEEDHTDEHDESDEDDSHDEDGDEEDDVGDDEDSEDEHHEDQSQSHPDRKSADLDDIARMFGAK